MIGGIIISVCDYYNPRGRHKSNVNTRGSRDFYNPSFTRLLMLSWKAFIFVLKFLILN